GAGGARCPEVEALVDAAVTVVVDSVAHLGRLAIGIVDVAQAVAVVVQPVRAGGAPRRPFGPRRSGRQAAADRLVQLADDRSGLGADAGADGAGAAERGAVELQAVVDQAV